MIDASFKIAAQAGILAFAEAVEVFPRRTVFQSADELEHLDGGVAVVNAAAQGLVHCLGVIHLAVAHFAFLQAEAVGAAVGIGYELLRGDELDAAIHHVASCHLGGVGMLAQQLQLGSQRAEGRLYATPFTKPHRCDLAEEVEEMPDLALAGMTILGAEVVDGVDVVLALYDGLGIEQGLAVVALRGSRLQFEEYSVSLTWHSGLVG